MNEIKIKGMQETMEVLDKVRKEFPQRVVVSTIKKSLKPFVKAIAQSDPKIPELKKVVSARTLRKTKEVQVGAGIWSDKKAVKHVRGKKPMRIFHLVYWKNYGTLSNRSSLHRFVKSRKRISRKWKGGIVPRGNIEKAWEETKAIVIQNLPVEAKKAMDKYLSKLPRQ